MCIKNKNNLTLTLYSKKKEEKKEEKVASGLTA